MTEASSSSKQSPPAFSKVSVKVNNIGGIETADLTFSPGVTILQGQNATNRTSLLRAIAAALGGTTAVLKRDANAGSVSLSIDGNRFTKDYERDGGVALTKDDTYATDSTLVDNFVCLLNDNPIRRAVRTGDDIADLLLAPIDTDELERKIAKLQSKRKQIDEQLSEIQRERKRLPKLEKERTNYQNKLEEIESELEILQNRTANTDRDQTVSDDVEAILKDLEETQTELNQTQSEITVQQDIRENIKEDLDDVKEELAQLDIQEDELATLNRKITQLQSRESEISILINELSTLLEQNRKILDEEGGAVAELTVGEKRWGN